MESSKFSALKFSMGVGQTCFGADYFLVPDFHKHLWFPHFLYLNFALFHWAFSASWVWWPLGDRMIHPAPIGVPWGIKLGSCDQESGGNWEVAAWRFGCQLRNWEGPKGLPDCRHLEFCSMLCQLRAVYSLLLWCPRKLQCWVLWTPVSSFFNGTAQKASGKHLSSGQPPH